MEKAILLLRSTLESCRAALVTQGVDPKSLLMEQVTFVLLVTSEDLPTGYTISHDVASGRCFPRKDGQLMYLQGEPVSYTRDFDARVYCWETAQAE